MSQRITFLLWSILRLHASLPVYGTWPTPLGQAFQWGHTRLVIRRK